MSDDLLPLLEAGFRAQQEGQAEQAEKLFRRLLARDADNVHALNLLGMTYVNSGRSREAVALITRALELQPNDPQAHGNLGLAYKDVGQADDAITHFRQSLRLQPDNPVMHMNLGNVLRVADQPKAAIASYEQALRRQRNFAECWSNLAAALNESDQHEAALKAVQQALALDPNLAQAYNNQGDILLAQARYEAALDSYRKATVLSPKYVAALINMARVQRDMDQPETAMDTLQKALALEPDNPEAHHVMGVLWEQMGDREAAARCYEAAINITPEMTIAHYNLAQIKGRKSTDGEFDRMRALWDQSNLNGNARMYLAFGISRALEQREQYDQAFEFLARGNRIKAQARPYDDADTARYLTGIVQQARAAVSRVGEAAGLMDPRPVFVLSMPRSGTSLTEQILASHSQVSGAGELSYAYDMVHRIRGLTGEQFPHNLARLSADQFRELGAYYLSRHAERNLATQHVVDKTPLNFQYIGVLALALPAARFIHCHREPVANCYAIHRMPFDEKQTYAHDLAALGRYYCRYRQLMGDWHALFPGRILDVGYEDTVSDAERQSRRMLDFLKLDFEPQVLEFYNTRRLVKTPSASQVREPIYRDSVAAWKKYEKHLGPLIDNLERPPSE